MNYLKISFIFLLTSFSFLGLALANSGPAYWDGYPGSDIMVIDHDNPIIVEGEELIFDFSRDGTVNGRVTATYQMFNPTDVEQSVQMVFPFVEDLLEFSSNNILVTSDQKNVAYEVFVGDTVYPGDQKNQYEFEKILNGITNIEYEGKHFSSDDIGTLYSINMKMEPDQSIIFRVFFQYNMEKSKVLVNGFNGYGYSDQTMEVSAWSSGEALELFVLGDDVDFTIHAYMDEDRKGETEFKDYIVLSEDLTIEDYLLSLIEKRVDHFDDNISETQLYNFYGKSLDETFTEMSGFSSEQELLSRAYEDRILSLVYTVDFPPNSRQEVSVSYGTNGTMDMTKTPTPLYTFDYIVNPAKNWHDFKDFELTIVTPDEAPFIVSSSIDLMKKDHHVYQVSLDQLPEEDLSFTLYVEEDVTFLDKGSEKRGNQFMVYAATFALILMIFALRRILYPLRKRIS
ncbi:hypothetical protein [Evansella tamaricis]|uniref:Uncharacterized protein n=1 Tax=Evansella tamaricis TaxID=2069301 RepID=A0ABS6JEB1_9BACI|nr:hypothetical protein [Evansella tamaricis]MBU9712015.1 hypothetical protein [Evansella tamaricis]